MADEHTSRGGTAAPTLDEADGHELLRIARSALVDQLAAGRVPAGEPRRASLLAPGAVFVTLRRAGELRGCIGTHGADSPIFRAVQEMAVAAATRDPRFPAMTAAELADVGIEVSVLGPRTPTTLAEVVPGRHGVAITAHGRRALLLPQVASEAGWDAGRLVAELCRKAGLPRDAWQDPAARLERFTAQIFTEASAPDRAD